MSKKTFIFSFLAILIFCFGLGLINWTNASDLTGDLTSGLESGIGGMDGVVKAAPTASPAAGTYHATQSVTLSASGSRAICYTTNGDTPACATATTCTTGTVYSSASPISVTSTATVKSIACYADASAGPANSGDTYTLTCSTASVSNGTVSAYSSCAITCDSGYTLSGSSCVASGGSSGGSGGSGGVTGYCSAVTYSDWSATCFGNIQSRSVVSSTPSGCTLTSAQQTAVQRTCQTATSTPSTTPTTPTTPTPTPTTLTTEQIRAQQSQQIATDAATTATANVENILANVSATRSTSAENSAATKYTAPLVTGLSNVSQTMKTAITNFVTYGTLSTLKLGAGERAGVVNSYKSAFGKLPSTEAQWSDVIKIANGRWPSQRSATAEANAAKEFKKVYKRSPDMKQPNDNAAVTVISYGLRPSARNTNSEKAAIKSFKAVYGHTPVSALAWDIVRAISYSGAKR